MSSTHPPTLSAAADEAMAYQVEITREKEKTLRTRLGEYKIAVVESLTPEQVAEFRKSVAKVYEDYTQEFGEDLFKKFGYTF